MSELLAWDGPWSMDLVNLMLPVAVEIETKREQAFYRAALAAIAAVFSKGDVGKKYSESLERVIALVRADQAAARGEAGMDHHSVAAQKLMDVVLPMMTRG
jgi:hypothetical protein